MHNLVVIASRRSGSTWIWNCIFDLIRYRWPDVVWQREFEPFEWNTVEMRDYSSGARRDYARRRHLDLPLFTSQQSPALTEIFKIGHGVKITKVNVGLGRAPAIQAYPNTTLIHVVRNPHEVLSSLRHEKFELASVDWPLYYKQYAPWLGVANNQLLRNAIRWSHDNWAVKGYSDLLISYNLLVDDPVPRFKALDALIVEKLGGRLGKGRRPPIEEWGRRVKRSTREIRLSGKERFLIDSICLPIWEELVKDAV